MKVSELVLLKNNQFLIANKPCGTQSVKSSNQDNSLQQILSAYTKKEIFPVHRIDQPVSGAMLFALTDKAFRYLSEEIKSYSIQRYYLGFVRKDNSLADQGELTHYLRKSTKDKKAFAFNKELHHTKKAELQYKKIHTSDNYDLLLIKLKTGRHHQIRAQFAAESCPLKGDVKYGFKRSNKDRSIDLHSWCLSFKHPVTQDIVTQFSPTRDNGLWNSVAHLLEDLKENLPF